MLEIPVYSSEGRRVSEMSIDEAHLGGRVRPVLLKQAVVMYQANRRQGTAATKCRNMVEGSTRKLYRQKGTGNARMGAVRTPQRRGGGRAFPKSPRDFGKHMPKRMRRLACRNAILAKILAEDVVILEELTMAKPRSQDLRARLNAVQAGRGCVLALAAADTAIWKSGRNIPRTDVRPVQDLNAYDVLRRPKLVFTKPAFEALVARAAKEHSE